MYAFIHFHFRVIFNLAFCLRFFVDKMCLMICTEFMMSDRRTLQHEFWISVMRLFKSGAGNWLSSLHVLEEWLLLFCSHFVFAVCTVRIATQQARA